MTVYYLLVIIPAITSLFYYGKKTEKSKAFTFFLFYFFLWVLLSLRSYKIGVDIANYKYYFETIRVTSWDNLLNNSFSIELGYVVINKIVGLITDNFSVFLSIIGFIILYPIYQLYKNESSDPLLSLVLFINMPVFVMVFSGLRQALAISISIIAYYFVKKRKFMSFILITLIAVAFHRSAVIIFALYPIYHSKITKKWIWFIIPAIITVFVFNKQLFSFFSRFLVSKYFERYSEIQSTGAYSMIILFALFLIFSYIMVDDKIIDTNTIGLRNIMIFILIIQLFAPIHTLAMRLNYYFLVYIPILIPSIISNSKNKLYFLAKTARLIMVLFFIMYFFYNAHHGADILQVFPYKFYWEA